MSTFGLAAKHKTKKIRPKPYIVKIELIAIVPNGAVVLQPQKSFLLTTPSGYPSLLFALQKSTVASLIKKDNMLHLGISFSNEIVLSATVDYLQRQVYHEYALNSL